MTNNVFSSLFFFDKLTIALIWRMDQKDIDKFESKIYDQISLTRHWLHLYKDMILNFDRKNMEDIL